MALLYPEKIVSQGQGGYEYGRTREDETGLLGALANVFTPVRRPVIAPEATTYTQQVDAPIGSYVPEYTPAVYGEPEIDISYAPAYRAVTGAADYIGGLFSSPEQRQELGGAIMQTPQVMNQMLAGQQQAALSGISGYEGIISPEGERTDYDPLLVAAPLAPAGIAARQAGGATLGAMGGRIDGDMLPTSDAPDTGILGSVDTQPLLGVPAQSHQGRISTRLPTAKTATENPVTESLQIGLDEARIDPNAFEHNVNIVKQYPNMTEAQANLPTDQAANEFVEHVKDNLLWVHDKVPDQTRERSKLWYDGARNITDKWSAEYGLPDTSIAGVLAALSPQMDWYKNVSLAERVLSTMAKRDYRADDKMIAFAKKVDPKTKKPKLQQKFQPIVDDILGKTLDELDSPIKRAIFIRLYDESYNPRTHNVISPEGDLMDVVTKKDGTPAGTGWGSFVEITKAVEAAESGGDKAILTPLMGSQHKVRSFYNNILDPNGSAGDVTIDTHAVAAGLLKPLSGQATEVHHNFGSSPDKKKQGADWKGATKNSSVTGVQGSYPLYAEAYRRAARERGILPREMQSITWEAARGLFTDVFKRDAKNVSDVDSIWQKYRKGKINIDEARDAIEQRAGGINPPTWQE